MKRCANCETEKEISAFGKDKQQKSGLKPYCKECVRSRWASSPQYRDQRKERYKKDKNILIERHRVWENKKRREDPRYRMRKNLARRLHHALKGKTKSKQTLELLGCTLDALRHHLEKLFASGMTWENYGEWEIDHITPCAIFDLTNLVDQGKCFHYTNLQPLWKADNLRKSNKHDWNRSNGKEPSDRQRQ